MSEVYLVRLPSALRLELLTGMKELEADVVEQLDSWLKDGREDYPDYLDNDLRLARRVIAALETAELVPARPGTTEER